jgi:hypothetical protein
MGIRSGLGGQIGLAPEVTYGTPVAPTKFLEGTFNIKDTSQYVIGGGVAAGRMQRLGSRRVKSLFGASGNIEQEVTNKGMGLLLQALMGTTVTPVIQGEGPGYLQTHTFADPWGKFFTAQAGLPDVSTGTSRPYTATGCKVLSAEFKCGVGELLTSTWEIDARELVEDLALAAASYPTTLAPFNFVQMEVKVGEDIAGAAHVEGVKSVSVKIDRASKADRNYAGNGGKKSEPVLNDFQAITGTLDVDYITKADFADRFHNGEQFALEWVFIGPEIGDGVNETFRLTLPDCAFTGDTPSLDGPDVISGSFPFETYFDGSTQPKIEYISTDSTL